MLLVVCVLIGAYGGAPPAAEAHPPHPQITPPMPAAEGRVSPPRAIAGLGERPARPLKFSRAWLGKMERVRERRAELRAKGKLDGMTPDRLAEVGAALSGSLNVPILPVRYADVAAPFSKQRLEERLFGPGRADTVSYAGYWREASGGLLDVGGEVAPWIDLPRDAEHYLPAEQYGWARFGRVTKLREQVIHAADEVIDFGRFDNDGPDGVPNSGDDDGYVDFVAILYAVPCQGDWRAGSIWPHRGAMQPIETRSRTPDGDRIKVTDYVILPVADPHSCEPLDIGVLAHETAHAFGLPDLYDYDGSSQGIGAWGLMGTGTHNASHSPAHPSAWSKAQLGWVRVDWLDRPGAAHSFEPVQRERVVYRYDDPDEEGAYLLFENRRRDGSDAHLPGSGLLVWRIDPERAEVGAWNVDEARRAVALMEADGDGDLADGLPADSGDPYPGRTRRRTFTFDGSRPLRLESIRKRDDTVVADITLDYEEPRLVALPGELSLVARAGGDAVGERVRVLRAGGAEGRWSVRDSADWLAAARSGDHLLVEADPAALEPGTYSDTIEIRLPDADSADSTDSANAADPVGGTVVGRLAVHLEVPAPGEPAVVASGLPWSWGLATHEGRIVQASYTWDPIGLRLRSRLFRLDATEPYPSTLARLPADALYAPTASEDGDVYVLARASGRNYVYRVAPDGRAALVTAGLDSGRAYGLTTLPGGDLLVAYWDGRIRRVTPDGSVSRWADLDARLYQIASDGAGTVYAVTYGGRLLRIDSDGRRTTLRTGFDAGGVVAVTATSAGDVFVAERGDGGRVLRIGPDGDRELVTRVPDAEFYGLATDDDFLYALDLHHKDLLRIPLGETGALIAAQE